ncbi:MAG: hypothetical protein D9V47_02350 [Clostridia bacterium]|nr:MAG: hypothetical protein D9V47_02350 [Clostridia bacterium]
MEFVADLHVHSRYSRATSRESTPENFYRWAIYKGVTLVGTGDFTHPAWREELQAKLEPAGEGLYRLKDESPFFPEEASGWGVGAYCGGSGGGPSLPVESNGRPVVRFVVSGEISTIYKKNGRVRKVHHLILLPGLEAAAELSRRLEKIGNLHSDGRPILGLDSHDLLEIMLETSPQALLIPAHIWTPHFSLLGANSGFDTVEECFGDLTTHICAAETGLSSDPPMNWRLSELDRLVLVSNSDAHSAGNLAREANLFDTALSYPAIHRALTGGHGFLGTLEFFPAEGKYHYDGHRNCSLRWHPSQTRAAGGVCPVCGRRVTIGVLHRVEELADREEGARPAAARPFESLVPLPEVVAAALGVGPASRQVLRHYHALLRHLGPELVILRQAPLDDVARLTGPLVTEAIRRMRAGEVEAIPGFDGEYGKIILLRATDRQSLSGQASLPLAPPSSYQPPPSASPGPTTLLPDTGEAAATEEAEPQWPGEPPAIGVSAPASTNSQPSIAGRIGARPGAVGSGRALAGLNERQTEAVTAATGPVIVMAGPGTGKTRTLVHRLAYLLTEKKVPARQITAVTFTNKAAQEIRQRVSELLGRVDGGEALTVGTFHSLCLELLQAAGAGGFLLSAPFPFILLDEPDARQVLTEVLQDQGRPAREAARLQEVISRYKNRGVSPASPAIPEEIRQVCQAYQERLAGYRALDYDDLLLQTVDMLETGAGSVPEVEALLGRFTHLLVDEFQDVNTVQYRLVKLWVRDAANLFVIGDPDQAIYGFRGADHRFFGSLKGDFPEAQVVHLAANYRSTPTILRAARAVMDGTRAGGMEPSAPGELVATRSDGSRILHLEVPGELAEGIAVVREIGRLVGGATMLQAHGQGSGPEAVMSGDEAWGFSDIAVLFRTGRQAEALEECFLKEGLPYRVVGRESFLEERPVRAALAFLHCVADPEDDFHRFQCLRSGPFAVSPRVLAAWRETAARRTGIRQVLAEVAGGSGPGDEKDRDRLLAFREALAACRRLAAGEAPAELLVRWLVETGEETASLRRLVRVADRFADLSSFLRGLTLAQEADLDRPGENTGAVEAVTLMTLHAAKGLEFPVVFITGVEDGLIPLKSRGITTVTAAEQAEERRLFYVGLTRARDLLILVSARSRTLYGVKESLLPSPFLADIPPDCLVRRVWSGAGAPKKQGEGAGYKQLRLFEQ